MKDTQAKVQRLLLGELDGEDNRPSVVSHISSEIEKIYASETRVLEKEIDDLKNLLFRINDSGYSTREYDEINKILGKKEDA